MGGYPESYVAYLVEFNATRDFFECHELLEEYWKANPGDGLSELWVGLIGIAVGQYHERRGNVGGAVKSYGHAESRLAESRMGALGVDGRDLMGQLAERKRAAGGGELYGDITIKLSDEGLMKRCLAACSERGLRWGTPSPMDNEQLVHRHKLRDRSEVIAAREHALHLRRRTETGEFNE